MDMAMLLAPLLILWLLAMLYVGPSYFRRLGQLIDRLEKHHNSEFERLGRPSLKMLRMTMGSTLAVVWFVLRKDYLQLPDDETTQLGNATRSRLMFSLAGALIVFAILLTEATKS